jgi:predicted site-specific integrase-resolvase
MPENQETQEFIRAVQYVRMSTEHQRYSLIKKQNAIAEYALVKGYEIIDTYADPGKSGLSLRGRRALQKLLSDALNPDRRFDAILVLDVSRWGRFQDPDQAAHYEFICRQAGLKVVYCSEAFENDNSTTIAGSFRTKPPARICSKPPWASIKADHWLTAFAENSETSTAIRNASSTRAK